MSKDKITYGRAWWKKDKLVCYRYVNKKKSSRKLLAGHDAYMASRNKKK